MRRVARALRFLLLSAGLGCLLLLLVGLAVSWSYGPQWEADTFDITVHGGTLFFKVWLDGDVEYIPGPSDLVGDSFGYEFPDFSWHWNRPFTPPWNAPWPAVQTWRAPHQSAYFFTVPLWLLAAVCLAWPVTSFVVRRRRRGRGFDVGMTNEETRNPNEARSPNDEGARTS